MSEGLVIVTEYRAEHVPDLPFQKTATRNTQMFLKGRELPRHCGWGRGSPVVRADSCAAILRST